MNEEEARIKYWEAEEARIKYWEAVEVLNEIIKVGAKTRQEILDELENDLEG